MDHNNSGWNLGRSSSAGGGIVPVLSADATATATGPSWRTQQNSQSTSEGSPSTRARGQSTWNRMKGAFKTSSREEQAKAGTGLDSATTATTLSSDAEEGDTTSGDELRSSAVELTAPVGSRLKVEAADRPQDWFDPVEEDGGNVQRSSSFTHARLGHSPTNSFGLVGLRLVRFFAAPVFPRRPWSPAGTR